MIRFRPTLALLALLSPLATAGPGLGQIVPVGRGSYTTVLPPGARPPSDGANVRAVPVVTSRVTGPVPTNDWWTSLAWKQPGNRFSDNLYADPLVLRARAGGLGLGASGYRPNVTATNIAHPAVEEITLGVDGLTAVETKVDGFSDWTVSALWSDGTRSLRATFGHGLPFVYAEITGGDALVQLTGSLIPISNDGGTLVVLIGGRAYALFAPTGSTWTLSGSQARSTLGGKGYYSVALLPDFQPQTVALFRAHAFAFVTDTEVRWSYDQPTAQVQTTFTATATPKEGTETEPLLALYRHQWKSTPTPLTAYTYPSPRGEMKLVAGGTFAVQQTFNGVLPDLPDPALADRARLESFVRGVASEPNSFVMGDDTYFVGKALRRLEAAIWLADRLGLTAQRDAMLGKLKARMERWFTASPNESSEVFYYEPAWGTMIGYPGCCGADFNLNDHHFHYGYWVMAAATIGLFDPAWVSPVSWGGMVDLLVRDVATSIRTDAMFPRLRNFDPYAGHSWADGSAGSGRGPNQESSSEAVNFAAGLILWGAATSNTVLRDRGIYLYTTEVSATEQYWFDVDEAVFPAAYDKETLGILWANGGQYTTFFGDIDEFKHGIQFLPITGGSLYLGRHPDYLRRNQAELIRSKGGTPTIWKDIFWETFALADPAASLADLNADPGYTPEGGESKAHTLGWIQALNTLGQLDTSVTADHPLAATFRKGDERTHVAYNAGFTMLTVRFSNGAALEVAPKRFASVTGTVGVGPDAPGTPDAFALLPASPNPFNPTTTFAYRLPTAGHVRLDVFDALGRRVRTLVDAVRLAGAHAAMFDAADLPAGLYLARLSLDGRPVSRTRTVTLLK